MSAGPRPTAHRRLDTPGYAQEESYLGDMSGGNFVESSFMSFFFSFYSSLSSSSPNNMLGFDLSVLIFMLFYSQPVQIYKEPRQFSRYGDYDKG